MTVGLQESGEWLGTNLSRPCILQDAWLRSLRNGGDVGPTSRGDSSDRRGAAATWSMQDRNTAQRATSATRSAHKTTCSRCAVVEAGGGLCHGVKKSWATYGGPANAADLLKTEIYRCFTEMAELRRQSPAPCCLALPRKELLSLLGQAAPAHYPIGPRQRWFNLFCTVELAGPAEELVEWADFAIVLDHFIS